MQTTIPRHVDRITEHRFYVFFAVLLFGAMFLGFSRTFFLRFWFPEWAAAHGPHEPFFYFHGAIFFVWLVLIVIQPSLIATGKTETHRRVGWVGAFVAASMIVLGVIALIIGARRPTGFIDVPIGPLNFMAIPLVNLLLFGSFVACGVVTRRTLQTHKRCMLLASLAMLDAGIARWPFAMMASPSPIPGFTITDLFVDTFLIPMILWDFISIRRLHRITFLGGLLLIASQPFRVWLAGTSTWVTIAGWLVNVVPR
jgi:hypothetical protein